jgi:hypothetical protein
VYKSPSFRAPPGPAGGAYSAPPDPLAVLRGGQGGEGKGREGKGKVGKGRRGGDGREGEGTGWEGRGGEGRGKGEETVWPPPSRNPGSALGANIIFTCA